MVSIWENEPVGGTSAMKLQSRKTSIQSFFFLEI